MLLNLSIEECAYSPWPLAWAQGFEICGRCILLAFDCCVLLGHILRYCIHLTAYIPYLRCSYYLR